MQLLIIPFAIAIGTFVLNRAAKRRDENEQQARKDREALIEAQRAEETTLQEYITYIAKMLTDPDRPLRRADLGANLSLVACAQTLTVLGRLRDGRRKRSVVQFLYEVG